MFIRKKWGSFMKRWGSVISITCLCLWLIGCQSKTEQLHDNGKLNITTTTGMIEDIIRNIGSSHVQVESLMGPGVDPHLYKASQGDINKLEHADLVFYSGLHLEGKMTDIFEKMGKQKPVVAVSDKIPTTSLLKTSNQLFDPHIWFDVKLWMTATESVREALISFDPKNKADYQKHSEEYLKQLAELDQYAKTQLSSIPKEQRVLVTAHDAFGYFGRSYQVDVVGLQGISTSSEYGLKDVQKIVNLLTTRKIKAVFIESSVPRRSIDAVVQGAIQKGQQVVIGGELFSDAMGNKGTPEGTYIGMVRHNVDTIVHALK
jgi:manganese/zinc/iron transport system substrate-binding protein